MIVTIDLGSDQPLFQQIVRGVKQALVDGELAPGDGLPPGRELSAALDVSLETVQRAYRQLAEEGIVISRVGRGTRIADPVSIDQLQVESAVAQLVELAREAGVSKSRLVGLLDAAFQ